MAAARTHDEEDGFERLHERLSRKIEHEGASVRAELSEKIDGVRELLDQRIKDQIRLLRVEIQRLEDRLVHETGALRTEIGGVKELLLSRMEQQERVRAAEYAATKWSMRSMMAAMAPARRDDGPLHSLPVTSCQRVAGGPASVSLAPTLTAGGCQGLPTRP